MTKVIVFGGTGGIGSCLIEQLNAEGFNVVSIARNSLNFLSIDYDNLLTSYLANIKPDWIFNCAGLFSLTSSEYRDIFDVNFGSNLSLVNYYLNNNHAQVKLIMLGSSAHNSGRKKYMAYSASKAAVHNLWLSARDAFQNTNIKVGIAHFGPVSTGMIHSTSKSTAMDPTYVADHLIRFCKNMNSSKLIQII